MKKRVWLLALVVLVLAGCQRVKEVVEIIPIQDNPHPHVMARALFPDAPDSLMTALNLQEGVPASVCAFLVKTQGKTILFDAANGAADSRLMSVLDSCQTPPEAIDYIFLTHLHGDHIGGLLQQGKAAFPRAELYINKVEYEAWMAMPQEKTRKLRSIVALYGDRLKTFELGQSSTYALPSQSLPCGIEAIAAYGHTAGHTVYRIEDILIVGDIMHGVALQLQYPQYCARFDGDKALSVQSRKAVLDMAKKEGLRIYGMHFPVPYLLDYR